MINLSKEATRPHLRNGMFYSHGLPAGGNTALCSQILPMEDNSNNAFHHHMIANDKIILI